MVQLITDDTQCMQTPPSILSPGLSATSCSVPLYDKRIYSTGERARRLCKHKNSRRSASVLMNSFYFCCLLLFFFFLNVPCFPVQSQGAKCKKWTPQNTTSFLNRRIKQGKSKYCKMNLLGNGGASHPITQSYHIVNTSSCVTTGLT